MSELLELAHLTDRDHVPDMQVGCAWIEAAVDPQGTPLSPGVLQPRPQLAFNRDLKAGVTVFGPLHEHGDLLIN